MKVLYFGCDGQPGHYLWNPGMSDAGFYSQGRGWPHVPWERIDGVLAPQNVGQRHGASALHHLDGWTAWAFWDRTVDTRPGCNSIFFAEGTHDEAKMRELAQEHFPEIWARVKEIVGDPGVTP